MKHIITIKFLLGALFGLTNCYGQNDPNGILETSRGTWRTPISNYKQIEGIEHRKHAYTFDKTDSAVTFISDGAYEVRASYEGKVVLLSKYDSSWSLTTRYGDYFISYIGLTKPDLEVGDYIEKGQFISLMTKGKNEFEYHFDFLLSKLDKSIDPRPWFR